MTKLIRDYAAEAKAWEEYKEQEMRFLSGEADKPPHPDWVPDVIYREVDDDQ